MLYQGGFSVDRGIEELVAALETPALSATAVVAAFIGYGRLRTWLDEQAARLPGRVIVLDAIAPADLQEFTVDADVGFVGQPGRTLNQRLNLANKLFEYLQTMVPVVVAEGTAHCDLVRRLAVGVGRSHGPNSPLPSTRSIGLTMPGPRGGDIPPHDDTMPWGHRCRTRAPRSRSSAASSTPPPRPASRVDGCELELRQRVMKSFQLLGFRPVL